MRHLLVPLVLLTILLARAAAQWSSDPAANLVAVDRAGEQTQPKLAPTADGGFYLAWFDNDASGSPAFGYDVYLQRFDAAGVEQWAHNGVRIADLGLSSTTDYDLDVDASGYALLAFQDDRGTGTQITAARVDPAGSVAWDLPLTSTTDFVANPKITGTSDGEIVVAWIQAASVRVQRLDASGAPQWTELVLLPTTGSYATGDLDAADAGTCILSLVHQTGGFSSPRHLRAQKLAADGSFLWGAGHVAVFDGGSLQIGNFPQHVPDGSGGAVFAWYSAAPALECFAQRVDAGGNELFPHDGTAVSTLAGRVRVAPAVAFDAAAQATYVVWVEKNSTQSLCGVGAQRLDGGGARQWGAGGAALVALGASAIGEIECLVLGGGGGDLACTWTASPSFGQAVAHATLLDGSGATSVPVFALSSTPAVKYRFEAATSAYGHGILAWRDERGADPDVYLQDLLPDGTLGGIASSSVRNGLGINVVCYTALSEPRIGTTWTTQVSHAHHPGATRTVVIGKTRAWNGPVLASLTHLAGQLLVGGAPVFVHAMSASGSADVHAVALPLDLSLVGQTVATQAVISGGAGREFTNAIDLSLGL
jgi:hypothetical protein